MPFAEGSGELCYFWAGSISAWHQPGNWTVNILYGWPPSSSASASKGSGFVSSKGRDGEEEGGWQFKSVEPGCSVLAGFCPPLLFVPLYGRRTRWEGNQGKHWVSCCLCIDTWCMWMRRENEVGKPLLTWQEADRWKSHLRQRGGSPVRCRLALELQSWPRPGEGKPTYPSPMLFQKMLSWMLMKTWHRYKQYNALSS